MVIAFDLDGTISNPFDGISRSINHALQEVGQKALPGDSLKPYIGPPLQVIFSELLEDPENMNPAIEYYLERYKETGYRENVLYDGVADLLHDLSETGVKLFVATSKRQDVAVKVLEHFRIDGLFDDILGCGLTRKKSDLLMQIKSNHNPSEYIMVGDRHLDMEAASQTGYKGIGVLWGFGSETELRESGADHLIENPHQLLEII